MQKSMIFAGMVTVAVAVIAVQAIRAPGVAIDSEAGAKSVAPFELMLNARDLPIEAVKNPV